MKNEQFNSPGRAQIRSDSSVKVVLHEWNRFQFSAVLITKAATYGFTSQYTIRPIECKANEKKTSSTAMLNA